MAGTLQEPHAEADFRNGREIPEAGGRNAVARRPAQDEEPHRSAEESYNRRGAADEVYCGYGGRGHAYHAAGLDNGKQRRAPLFAVHAVAAQGHSERRQEHRYGRQAGKAAYIALAEYRFFRR